MDLQFTQRTLQNNKKKLNEDYSLYEIVEDAHLFVIADGNDMSRIYTGSTPDLNVSRIACEQLIANCRLTYRDNDIFGSLDAAFDNTLKQVCKKIKEVEQHKYQSTTLTSLAIFNGTFFCKHVGDSALYHFSKASQAATMITPLNKQTDTAVFIEPAALEHIRVFKQTAKIEPGDVLLLTTDGLLLLWSDGLADKLKELSIAGTGTSDIVDRLFAKGIDVKGRDDLTCFLIRAIG